MILAKLILQLRAEVPGALAGVEEGADFPQSVWRKWHDQAIDALQAQAELAAIKINCVVLNRRPSHIERRLSEPAGVWLLVEFEMEHTE